MTHDVTLRPYQTEAVKAFLAARDGKGTIKAAPGSGKTIIAASVARGLLLRGDDWLVIRTLVITPTIDLVNQWKGVFRRLGFDPAEYEVVTYALAARRADDTDDEGFWKGFNFIVADEMHHLAEGPVFQRILSRILETPFALGLSATPPMDPDNLALRVLPVVYEYTLDQARDEGYAAPVKVHPIPVRLTEDERRRYDNLTGLIRTAITRAGSVGKAAKTPAAWRTDPETGADVVVYGGQLMTERKQLVAMAEAKFGKLEEIVYTILGFSSCASSDDIEWPARLFVWSEYIDALQTAKDALNRNGRIAELVTGQTPKKERRRLLTEAWGTEFPVLLIAKIGEEGLDYPEVAHGIILAGAKTSRQNVQRIGRLMRPLPGKTAKLWVLFAERTMEERLVDLADALT